MQTNTISSNDIEDKHLTEKTSIAKLMRISCQRTNSYIGFFHGEKWRFPFWEVKKFQ